MRFGEIIENITETINEVVKVIVDTIKSFIDSYRNTPVSQDDIKDTIDNALPEDPSIPEVPVPEDNSIPQEQPVEEPEENEPATDETVPEDTEEDNEKPACIPSHAGDDSCDGINSLYFAKQYYKKTGNEIASEEGGEYLFTKAKTYTPQPLGNYTKDGDAQHILDHTEGTLSAKKEFAIKSDILNKITDTIEANTTIKFKTYKKQVAYEKTDNAPLESELYVFAKTFNLDTKEITINIKEKEPLLLDEADANLNVVLVEGEGEDAIEGEEVTDLKAIVEDGQAAIKIMLKPKDEENEEGTTPNLDDWRLRIKGIVEDGTYSYAVEDTFTTDSDLDTVAGRIESESNDVLKPSHFVLKEDIIPLLVEKTTYNNTTTFVFPKYKEELKRADDYTYTFTNPNGTAIGHVGTDNRERREYIGGIIVSNINEGKKLDQPEEGDNPKLKNGITIKLEDVVNMLTESDYARGSTIVFPSYKKIKPLLWLKGTSEANVIEDLNQNEDTYFEIGNDCPRCREDFKYEDIVEIFSGASQNQSLANELIQEMNKIKDEYGINTCIRKAHLINQFGSETEFKTLIEDLGRYSVTTLVREFGYFRRHPAEAETYHGNLREIAIRAYGLRKVDTEAEIVACNISQVSNCNVLGNETKEDGFRYIGRGLIQLTGKYNYTQINKSFIQAFPGEGDLVSTPELLETPKYAVMSALSYWINNDLNSKADLGYEPSNVDGLTEIINKGLSEGHYEKRRNSFLIAKRVYRLDECEGNEDLQQPKEGYDIDAAVNYVISNSLDRSIGYCARHVRLAVGAGGITISPLSSAFMYIEALPTYGFTNLGNITNYVKGDIVVFNRVGNRVHGHIAMWTGEEWVSDFRQRSITVHTDYIGQSYHIFRWQ